MTTATHNVYAAAFSRTFLKNPFARALAYVGFAAWSVFAIQGLVAFAIIAAMGTVGGGLPALAMVGILTWWLVQNMVVGPTIVMIRAWVSADAADRLQRWSNLWD